VNWRRWWCPAAAAPTTSWSGCTDNRQAWTSGVRAAGVRVCEHLRRERRC
jgi:hypothetical protein